jgi:hypothetical protein
MRILVAWVFVGLTSLLPAFGQSNTTAGLAGVGAGAALAGNGQNGTSASSAAGGGGGGGGSAPIEIQTMVFQGMKEIASEIATLTASYQSDCATALNSDDNLTARRDYVMALIAKLEADSAALHGDRGADQPNLGKITDARKQVREDESKLAAAKAALNLALDALPDATKKVCSILVEDSVSSNQTGLYQAVQGYYSQLQQLDGKLQPYFALQITPSLSFSFTQDQAAVPKAIVVLNGAGNPRKIKGIIATGSPAFDVDTKECLDKETLIPADQCSINVTFPRDGVTVQPDKQYPATVSITSGDPNSDRTDVTQTVQLTATVTAAPKPETEKQPAGEKSGKKPGQKFQLSGPFAATASGAGGGTSGGGGGGGGGGGATTPLGLTYLGDLQTALGALKSNITYGASGFQPTPQSFQLMVESELKERGIFPYTSTSALNLQDATSKLSAQFAQMLSWATDINGWANTCKPSAGGATAPGNAMANTACGIPDVSADLAIGQQIVTGYTTLVTSANDGSGSPVIVSVLRGMILASRVAEGIPSLQLNVATAGGSTRTNNIFFVNLFYTFAPSYNAGVIATFELRDKNNVLVDSGARNSMFAYTKWKSKSFHPMVMRGRGTCDSFCSVK